MLKSHRNLLLVALAMIAAGILFALPWIVPTSDRTHPSSGAPPATGPQVNMEAAPQPDAPLVFQAVPPETAEVLNATRPDFTGPLAPASVFRIAGAADSTTRALDCLTAAIYYEARSETLQGQRAVAQVVLNRARDPLYPASVCGVVFQGAERSTGCQFSFTCDGSMSVPPRPALWENSRAVARMALAGYVERSVGLATHYHTRFVVPVWRTDLIKLRTIGAHIFYGWRGRERSGRGLRASYAAVEPALWPTLLPYAATIADSGLPEDPTIATFAPSPATPEDRPVAISAAPKAPSKPIEADAGRGALVTRGSTLKLDDNAPVPLSRLGGTVPQ